MNLVLVMLSANFGGYFVMQGQRRPIDFQVLKARVKKFVVSHVRNYLQKRLVEKVKTC